MRSFLPAPTIGALVLCWVASCNSGDSPQGNDPETCETDCAGGGSGGSGGDSGAVGGDAGGGGDAGSDAGTSSGGATTAGSGMGGSATGGSGSGAGGQGGTGGGLAAGSFYILWSDLQSNAFITELDRQTGETIRDVPLTMGPSPWAMDLAVAPDGTFRVMYPLMLESNYATMDILSPALQVVERNSVGVAESYAMIYAKRRDGTGRLWEGVVIGGVPIIRMWALAASDDYFTSMTPILNWPAETPIDYFALPNGEARVLTSLPTSGQSRVFFLDQNEALTPNSIEYDHPGVESVSYAVYEDGVWTSFSWATGGVVCAAASESEVVFDVAAEGWGVGACRSFAPPAPGYAFVDLAGPP